MQHEQETELHSGEFVFSERIAHRAPLTFNTQLEEVSTVRKTQEGKSEKSEFKKYCKLVYNEHSTPEWSSPTSQQEIFIGISLCCSSGG